MDSFCFGCPAKKGRNAVRVSISTTRFTSENGETFRNVRIADSQNKFKRNLRLHVKGADAVS